LPFRKSSRQDNVLPEVKQDRSIPSCCSGVHGTTVYLQKQGLATCPRQWK